MQKSTAIASLCLFFLISYSANQKQDADFRIDTLAAKGNPVYFNSVSSRDLAYRNLSDEYNLNVHIEQFQDSGDIYDSSAVRVLVTDKKNNDILDTLFLTAVYNWDTFFRDANNGLSYSTGVNINKQIVDNYAGDIVVADFNFDNRDDIAIISDAGGNGGVFYTYFLQNDKRKFLQDDFLTDSMTYFPTTINKDRNTLTTLVHAGACCVGKTVYYFDKINKRWIKKSHIILGLKS